MSKSPADNMNTQPSTPTNWSPSMSPQVSSLGQHLVDSEINALEQRALFLGSDQLMHHVEWHEEGLIERLVHKSQNSDDPEQLREEAVMEFIAKISANDSFYMDQIGGWTGKFGDLYQSKASCHAVAPSPSHTEYWQKVLDTTSRLMQDRRKKQGEIRNGIIVEGNSLRIRHSVFNAVDYETYKARSAALAKMDKGLLMSNWSCGFSKAQKELASLIWHNNEDKPNSTRYFGNPLPVWYHDRQRLLPSDPEFSNKLRGATARIGVTITHEYISRSPPLNDFYADVRYIIILKKPPPPSKAPLKHTLDFPDIFSPSDPGPSKPGPSKRSRA